MEVIIGRKGSQAFAITDKKVSGKHLKATKLDNDKILIEDLGSTNGTFVDGVRIIKKTVSKDAVITLGSSYRLCIGDVFSSADDIAEKFERLNKIYKDYEKAKIKIQQENARKQFYRSLPGLIPTIILPLTFLLGDSVDAIKPFMIVIVLAGLAISSSMAYKGQQDMPIKMEALNKQFMLDYVCPKCKNFLGFLPFENLKNKGYCSMCKTKWK